MNIELSAKFLEQLFFGFVELMIATFKQRNSENEKIVFTLVTLLFYCLRYLYSLPNRRYFFRKVFPPQIYSLLVDVVLITNNFQAFQNIAQNYLKMQVIARY
jgi:hypothetical protein